MNILIAEDDDTSRLLLGTTLRKLGHDITVTSDGDEAWAVFQRNPDHSVVITDWLMPGMPGIELCRRIRTLNLSHYTYVLILTSLSGKGKFLEGMDAGADDYVTKPFDRDELAARLRVAERIIGLKQHVERLEGLLPICSYCKKIREPEDVWTSVERYVAKRSEASFTHGICPTCIETEVEAELSRLDMAGEYSELPFE